MRLVIYFERVYICTMQDKIEVHWKDGSQPTVIPRVAEENFRKALNHKIKKVELDGKTKAKEDAIQAAMKKKLAAIDARVKEEQDKRQPKATELESNPVCSKDIHWATAIKMLKDMNGEDKEIFLQGETRKSVLNNQ